MLRNFRCDPSPPGQRPVPCISSLRLGGLLFARHPNRAILVLTSARSGWMSVGYPKRLHSALGHRAAGDLERDLQLPPLEPSCVKPYVRFLRDRGMFRSRKPGPGRRVPLVGSHWSGPAPPYFRRRRKEQALLVSTMSLRPTIVDRAARQQTPLRFTGQLPSNPQSR